MAARVSSLTICRRLVELMGGRIWLESEPGVAATCYSPFGLILATQQTSRQKLFPND